jgi:hypothetical protein
VCYSKESVVKKVYNERIARKRTFLDNNILVQGLNE